MATLTHDEFVARVYQDHGNSIEVVGVFTGVKNRIDLYCNVCSNRWSPFAEKTFYRHQGCPVCAIEKRANKRRLSHEEYVRRVTEYHNGEIQVLSRYTGDKCTVKCRHDISTCGYEWDTSSSNLIYGKKKSGCPKCGGNLPLTQDEFLNRVNEKHGGTVMVLGAYVDYDTKVLFKHNVPYCQHEWTAIPYSVYGLGTSCPECDPSKKLTHDEFLERLQEIHGKEIRPLDLYIRGKDHIRFIHDVEWCGYTWSCTPNNMLHHECGCPKCAGVARVTHKQFVERVKVKHGKSIEVIGTFISMSHKVKVRCTVKDCGREWDADPNGLANRGRGCLNCGYRKSADAQRFTHEEFIERLNDIHDGEIEVLSQYIKMVSPIVLRHKACDHVWTTSPASVIYGQSSCPACNASKGEELVRKILADNGAEFIRQFRFDDCRYINTLPFDFVVFDDDQLVFLIEYDGIQHYKPVDMFGGDDEFRLRKIRDGVKDDYCASKPIPLLRIPYWHTDEEVEQIIDQWLQQYVHSRELQLV